MARLRGELDLIGIDTLFQAFSARGVEGYLDVRRNAERIILAISPAGLRLVSGIRRSKPLGEILVRAGKMTQEQLDTMLLEQRKSSTPLGELVVQSGILPKSVIENALRKQVAEEIHELFSWTGALFEFRLLSEGAPPADDGPRSAIVLDGNIVAIMLEAARRTDELQQIRMLISDDRLVPVLTELPGILDDPGIDRHALEEILPLVNGERSVEEILEVSLHPKFTVLRTLYGLVMSEVLKIRDRGRQEGPITVLRRPRTHDTELRRERTVLVLSDSPSFGPALSMLIRNASYSVLENKLSTDPTQVLANERVDAIVVELALDRPEARDYCRSLAAATRVPFIAVTPFTGPQLIGWAMESGARYVLLKPLDEERLLDRLGELLILPPPPPAKEGFEFSLGT
jgi:CheY-like chemotaxis protein